MSRSRLLNGRLGYQQRKVNLHSVVYYADRTAVGSIIDETTYHARQERPIAIEVWRPKPQAWQVIESHPDFERALPRARLIQEKGTTVVTSQTSAGRDVAEAFGASETYRVRDRRTDDFLMADVL